MCFGLSAFSGILTSKLAGPAGREVYGPEVDQAVVGRVPEIQWLIFAVNDFIDIFDSELET